MFHVPSTPDSRRGSDTPSTTPAGPPPTGFTSQSFTPAGPPPSSVFGSSFGGNHLTSAGKPAFAPSGQLNSPSINRPLHTNPFGSRGFTVPSSSPPRAGDGAQDGDFDAYSDDTDGENVDTGMDVEQRSSPPRKAFAMSAFQDSPQGAKRSRNGEIMGSSMRTSRMLRPLQDRGTRLMGPAKSLAAGMPVKQNLEESDEMILSTEAALSSLEHSLKVRPEEELDLVVTHVAQGLSEAWRTHTKVESTPGSIGPTQKSPLAKANYIASLIFQLHHPAPMSKETQKRTLSFGRQPPNQLVRAASNTTVPKALIDWLNTFHNPFPEDLPEVLQCRPSSTAHERFWDTVFASVLRGNIQQAIRLLQNANFAHAESALEDGYQEPGYRGRHLSAIQTVVGRCIQLLETCPAYTDDDWDVKNTDWSLFRSRVRQTMEDLEAYAEESSADHDYGTSTNIFQNSTFGGSMSAASRRAESKVPWTVYEQLKAIYGQLLGYREEILLTAQDWLEAVIYLTAWWDGDDDEGMSGNIAASRRSFKQAPHTREVDVSPVTAYKKRLVTAFASVTDEPEDAVLGVNVVDPVQVALASICEDNVEGVIGLLRGWSLPIAASAVDIASAAGWLPESRTRSRGVMDGFDQDDLMVLSHGQMPPKDHLERDSILSEYADKLAQRGQFQGQNGEVKEGWELAVNVLSRLDSTAAAERKIANLFEGLSFESSQQVDKALAVCGALGLARQTRSISERYADRLAETTHSYGEAIIYYARARSTKQLQSTLDLLITTSLVQSAAYPPTELLDRQLDLLLNDQRNTLTRLARVDIEAAQVVATRLSGYASLRRFYDLRDENDEDEGGRKSGLRPLARRKEAAKAVLALISSAADSISGGLYDAGTDAIVQVDALLALLGEALPLMDQPKPLFKPAHLMMILQAAEDVQTVTSRVFQQTESLFQAAMSDYNGARINSPQDLAKSISKSTSNLSASSYGMVNSRGSLESEGKNGATDDRHRGWDWRKGIALAVGKNATGNDVLRILRCQIAKEMARAWTDSCG